MMKWARHSRARTLLAALVFIVAITTLIARIGRVSKDQRRNVLTWSSSSPSPPRQLQPKSSPEQNKSSSPQLTPSPALPSPTPPPLSPASPSSSPYNNSAVAPEASVNPGKLIIPVAGVRPDQLRDTFSEARSEGRIHDAIDIPAPRGTPVLAAADGKIVKLFQSERGGTTIYQLSADNKFVYYYAHLDRYAEGLTEGHFAKQGETIAYVGDTGNAGAGNYHLHFSIAEISDPRLYWDGININPYPLLRR